MTDYRYQQHEQQQHFTVSSLVDDQTPRVPSSATAAGATRPGGGNTNTPQHDSRFNCNICLESVSEPVVTQCGHLYCWSCLYRWLEPGMTNAERFDMGWISVANAGGRTGVSRQSGRRCCPVCKADCVVGTVVPIYVRESDDDNENDAAAAERAAAASATTSQFQGTENDSVDIGAPHDRTATTGLRRRRRGADCDASNSITNTNTNTNVPIHDSNNEDNDTNNDHDILSLSTISTEDHVEDSNDRNSHSVLSPTTARMSPDHHQSSSTDIPSRPTPQPYLRQRSSMEEEPRQSSDPMTPRTSNHHHGSGGGGGGGGVGARGTTPLPPSPPRAARPSSLSNGLSLSFWTSVVDAILGNSPHGRNGAGTGAGGGGRNGSVPPIHRPGSWRGRHRSWRNFGGGNSGGNVEGREGVGPGPNGREGGDESQSVSDNTSSGMGSSAIAVPHFPPALAEDATTEFLSRLLLLLGSFVIFCLLLF